MKKILILASAALVLASCAGNGYKVTGKLDGYKGEKLFLSDGTTVLASADVANGKFTFTGDLATMDKVYVIDSDDFNAARLSIPFYLERGTTKIANSEDGSFTVKGTPGNEAIANFYSAASELVALATNGSKSERRLAAEKYYELMKTYALKNLDNVAGLEFLALAAGESIDGDELIDAYNKCSDAIKATKKWDDDFTYFNHRNEIINGEYINFSQPSVSGERVSLESVVNNPANKYVLVDFWASWSSECMDEIIPMKAAYAKYNAKGLEIFSSSLDMNETAWKDAVAQNDIKWIQVSDLQYWRNFGAALYAVRAIPTNFLVDCATGKIIAHDLTGAELDNKMAELLGE